MKITLPLVNPLFDDNRLTDQLEKDFEKECQIYIYKDEHNWLEDEDNNVFSLWVEYGKDKEFSLMFDAKLDDLELFAHTLIKSIEMFRRDYKDDISKKIKKGLPI